MFDYIVYYIAGGLAVCGLQTIWFCSNFPIHVMKLIRVVKPEDEVYSWEDLTIHLIAKSDFFGELLCCTVCLSVWFSVAVASFQTYFFELSLFYTAATVLGWPALAYMSHKLTNKDG